MVRGNGLWNAGELLEEGERFVARKLKLKVEKKKIFSRLSVTRQ